ncbi:hypothetical protein AcV5_009538 [Taiwanofungus camphoratus]|nr:hypothetical protein AcV5_009538 [Antrodia cinnamomea]
MDPHLTQPHLSHSSFSAYFTGLQQDLSSMNPGTAGLSAYPSVPMPAVGELVRYDPSSQSTEQQEEVVPEGAPGTVLEVKHLHEVFDYMTQEYIIKPALPFHQKSSDSNKFDGSKYTAYAFTVIRKFSPSGRNRTNTFNITTELEIHSKHLIEVGQGAIGQIPGISWTAMPLRVDPQILLAWLPELQKYCEDITKKFGSEPADSPIHETHAHLEHLLKYLSTTHASTLATLSSLLAHDEINFDLLWAIYVPRKTILYTLCPITGEPRAVRLVQAQCCQKIDMDKPLPIAYDPIGLSVNKNQDAQVHYLWRLVVDYVEADVGVPGEDADESRRDRPPQFGYAGLSSVLDVNNFKGTKKISKLPAFPIQYYSGPGGVEGLKDRLIKRGKKWAGIAGGIHHLAYRGIAFRWVKKMYVRFSVDSRVMVDRRTFIDIVPNYPMFPMVRKTLSGEEIDRHALRAGAGASDTEWFSPAGSSELSDEEYMLTSPIVYGFSLLNKQWLEFSVDHVEPFQWNDEGFTQLVIPAEHKMILKTLVETYSSGTAMKFDDFISGKGLGLVINLFGNPGTGKSLTAEAMSEYMRKPLYVVGAADLGTTAEIVDANLTTVFKVSACWEAVVLIDEADVFLEERSLQFLERNAMVAVFLRQLEYFRGILFLTTNRVRVFDEAFQSRIHVSLRYLDLSPNARRQIWVAFMRKVNGDISCGGLSEDELRELADKKVNGRQIKNVVKTAGALAIGRQEKFGYQHIIQVLNLMEQFDTSHSMYQ